MFHIIFIAVSTLLAFGFGIWLFYTQPANSAAVNSIAALLAFAIGIGLIVYGIQFLRKIGNVGNR